MSQLLNPHLTVEVDTEPFYADQVEAYKTALFMDGQMLKIRMTRGEALTEWLVKGIEEKEKE